MSEVKTVKLGKKTVTARELTVAEIVDLVNSGEDNPAATIVKLLTTCTSATREDLVPLAPSELDPLIEAMLEVNNCFFVQQRAIGMSETAENMARLIRSISVLPFLP